MSSFLWLGNEHKYDSSTLGGQLLALLDQGLYLYVPTTVGLQVGSLQGQIVAGFAGGALGVNRIVAWNVRSGEVGVLTGSNGSLCLCVGEDLEVSGGIGPFLGYGGTRLKSFTGPSHAVTVFGKVAAALGLNGDFTVSLSANGKDDPTPLVDPVSGHTVRSGILAFGMGAGEGIGGGVSYSPPILNDTTLEVFR